MVATSRDSTVLVGSFLLWCALLTYPLMAVDGSAGPDNRAILYQLAGLSQYAAVCVVLYAPRIFYVIQRYDYLQYLILLLIFLSVGLQLYGDEISILAGTAYTIALIITIVLLSVIHTMDDEAIRRCLGGAAILFLGFALVAMALFGLPGEDRYIGEIHPNTTGSVMLMGFVFSQFCKGRAWLLLRALCLVVAAAVSSRFAVLGCLLAFLIFEMTLKPNRVKTVLLLALIAITLTVFPDVIANVFALDDPTRGAGSGFSGRDEEWITAFEEIVQNPWGAGFKRVWAVGTGQGIGHNGYLKMFLDFGVMGGSLIDLAIVGIVLQALFKAVSSLREDIDRHRFACARGAGLAAVAFASFFQPQIFNLGDVHGMTCMLLLFTPGAAVRERASRPRELYGAAIGR